MILPLASLISRAIEQSLEDRVAVSFSGGLDSTIIALVAKKHSDVELFTAGTESCDDMACAGKVAAQLGLPLTRACLDAKTALDAYGRCHALLPMDLLKLEILVPAYCAAEAAAGKGHRVMLFGAGAEELFVGYERYYLYREEGKDLDAILKEEFRTLPQREIAWIKKICRHFGIEARFPFYDRELAELMFSVPLDERMHDRELKKGILREAAKMLGVPELVVRRKKKAMQYGSGIHKIFMQHAEYINRAFPPA